MKTENNLQNKAAFMAQYWGQKVAFVKKFPSNVGSLQTVNSTHLPTDILELTPIDQITDEDLDTCISLLYDINSIYGIGSEPPTIEDVRMNQNIPMLGVFSPSSGYLISKGYAVQWRDLSVNDLVEYGWVKLK